MVYILLDHRSLPIRIECVFNQNRYILVTHRIDGRRINHFCTEVTELRRFNIGQLTDGVGRTDHPRIGSHKAIHICPYLQAIGTEGCGNDGGSIVGATASQIGHVSRNLIRRNKSRYE